MKCLERNKRTVYFKNRIGSTELTDEYGNVTGEFSPLYSDVALILINESAARGTVDVEQFGLNTAYSKTLVTSDLHCPLAENSVLWIGFSKISEYVEGETYTVGDLAIVNGSISKYVAEDTWEEVPYNYIVVSVAKSLNSVTYAIREVKVNG